MNLKLLTLLSCFFILSLSHSSSSVFPETALAVYGGYYPKLGLGLEAELRLPIDIIDSSLSLGAFLRSGDWGLELSNTNLIIPAWGTTPPLAIGFGTDLSLLSLNPETENDPNFALKAHVGPMLGSDLLFSLDLPMTLSAYLGLGFDSTKGFDIAWHASLRYYLEELPLVLEIASSQNFALRLGLRYLIDY
ncbi:MAG: hypothetical protein R2880_16995 [Deinococcales bacterium]